MHWSYIFPALSHQYIPLGLDGHGWNTSIQYYCCINKVPNMLMCKISSILLDEKCTVIERNDVIFIHSNTICFCKSLFFRMSDTQLEWKRIWSWLIPKQYVTLKKDLTMTNSYTVRYCTSEAHSPNQHGTESSFLEYKNFITTHFSGCLFWQMGYNLI